MEFSSTNIRFIDYYCVVYVLFCMFPLKQVTIRGAGSMVMPQKTYTQKGGISATLQLFAVIVAC
jgi:hypothetical protein